MLEASHHRLIVKESGTCHLLSNPNPCGRLPRCPSESHSVVVPRPGGLAKCRGRSSRLNAVQGQDHTKSQCGSELRMLAAQSLTFRRPKAPESNSGFQGGILEPQSHACEGPRPQKPECTVQSEIRDARLADELNGSSLANTRAVTD